MFKLFLISLLFILTSCFYLVEDNKEYLFSDNQFQPMIKNPAYAENTGPQVYIDKFHNNFHTAEGRYQPFADLLRQDGYRVKSSSVSFDDTSLMVADILVIVNAVGKENESMENWILPSYSAFTESEVVAVSKWVNGGGALFLVADHMPWSGAASSLAESFGILFHDGFSEDASGNGNFVATRDNSLLSDHPIINGRTSQEKVDHVMSFYGQAFRISSKNAHTPLLLMPENFVLRFPLRAWGFDDATPVISAEDMYRGAVLKVGKGRVAVFGEAGMFTAQLVGKGLDPMGMNHPDAKHNTQFLLNVMHWLSGLLADK